MEIESKGSGHPALSFLLCSPANTNSHNFPLPSNLRTDPQSFTPFRESQVTDSMGILDPSGIVFSKEILATWLLVQLESLDTLCPTPKLLRIQNQIRSQSETCLLFAAPSTAADPSTATTITTTKHIKIGYNFSLILLLNGSLWR